MKLLEKLVNAINVGLQYQHRQICNHSPNNMLNLESNSKSYFLPSA